MEKKSTNRYESIQVMRFVAALMVVILHSTFYASERLDRSFPMWSPGAHGVDIFFVISGFVMVVSSKKLFGTDGGWIKFLQRRAIRIFPLYWAVTTANVLILLAAPALVLHTKLEPFHTFASYALIPAHGSEGKIEPIVGVGWTLVFEMFFYYCFALCMAQRRNPLLTLTPIFAVFAALSYLKQADWPAIAFYLNPKLLEFCAGMAIAYSRPHIDFSRASSALMIAVGFIFTLVPVFEQIDFFPTLIGPILIILGAIELEAKMDQRFPRALTFLGDASYAIYLMHPMTSPVVPMILKKIGFLSFPTSVAISIVVGLLAGSLVHVLFERPVTRGLTSWLKGPMAQPKVPRSPAPIQAEKGRTIF